jgi:hypothetical protein
MSASLSSRRPRSKVEPEITARRTGVLGAVDVYTRENAITVTLSHIVDAPKDLRFT